MAQCENEGKGVGMHHPRATDVLSTVDSSAIEKRQRSRQQEIGMVIIFYLLLYSLNVIRILTILPWEGQVNDVLATLVDVGTKGIFWIGLPFLFIRYGENQAFLSTVQLKGNIVKGVLIGFFGCLMILTLQFVRVQFAPLALFLRSPAHSIPFTFFGTVPIISAGIIEEVAFRGYLLPKLQSWMDDSYAIILNALLFTLIHIPLWLATGQHVIQSAFVIFPVSLLLCAVVVWSRSLWSSMLLHTVYNFIQLFFS